jgi:hypothetical protein
MLMCAGLAFLLPKPARAAAISPMPSAAPSI